MSEIKGFILALVGTAVSSALVEGIIPEGGMKKFVRYLLSLMILLALITPLYDVIALVPTLVNSGFADYDSVQAYTKANSIVALRIEKSLCDKFSLDGELVDVVYDGDKITVSAKRRLGLVESDFISYIESNFGVLAEVSFYG